MKLAKRFAPLIAAFALLLPLFMPVAVRAANIDYYLCVGVNLGESDNCDEGTLSPETTITDLSRDIIDVLSLIVGIVSVIMIILGGLRYITSGGDPGNVTTAKNTILYAIVGLVIVLFSQAIVQFIIGRFTQN